MSRVLATYKSRGMTFFCTPQSEAVGVALVKGLLLLHPLVRLGARRDMVRLEDIHLLLQHCVQRSQRVQHLLSLSCTTARPRWCSPAGRTWRGARRQPRRGREGGIGDQELGGWLQYQYAPHQLKGKVALGAIPVLPMRHILPWEVQRDPAAMGCAAPAAPAAAMAMGRWGLPRKALRRWRSGDGRYQGRACRPRRAMGGRW